MFTLHLDRRVPARRWWWTGARWESPGGRVEPYSHVALNHRLLTTPTRTLLVSWERARGEDAVPPGPPESATDPEADTLLSTIESFDLDWTVAKLTPTGVTLRAGTWCIAPLYLRGDTDTFTASWDPGVVRTDGPLLEREVSRLLQTRHRYGHDTIWRGVFRLSERSTAEWSGGAPTLVYPPAAEHVQPRDLRPGADVLAEFDQLVHIATTRRHASAADSALELSGGLDSACVATALAHDDVTGLVPTSVIMSGSLTGKQVRRRTGLLAALGIFGDTTVTAADHLPFGDPMLVTTRTPNAEPWYEAKIAMLDAVSAQGAVHSFGGTGGDELIAYGRPEELPVPVSSLTLELVPWLGPCTLDVLDEVETGIAPPTRLPETTLLAFASRAPMFLSRGIWPVSPLADPELGRFVESLPGPWCWNKTLHRLHLARAGLDRDLYSDTRDDPSKTLSTAVRENVIPFLHKLLDTGGSMLVDEGFVDPDALRATLRDSAVRREETGVVQTLLKLATIEAGLAQAR